MKSDASHSEKSIFPAFFFTFSFTPEDRKQAKAMPIATNHLLAAIMLEL